MGVVYFDATCDSARSSRSLKSVCSFIRGLRRNYGDVTGDGTVSEVAAAQTPAPQNRLLCIYAD
jgi:hypothetical protein